MRPRMLFIVESGADVRMVEGLAEGFDLSILARRIPGGVEISRTPAAHVKLKVGPAPRLAFAWAVLRELWRARGATDCVVVQGYGAAALAANVAGRVLRVPVFMLVCSPVEKYYFCRRSHPAPDKPFRRRELFALKMLARANAVVGQEYVVLSRHLESVVREHGTRRPVCVIPVYGVDTGIFSPAKESRRVLKERMGLPASGALIFFSSRVAPEKDAETLLAAVRSLVERGHDLWLLHRSGGFRDFNADARRFGLADRVVATDAVHPHEQLADDYRAADLCVQASREEGLGFSPLEALACGTPVVAADVGGLRETIINGQTGWSYHAGDAEDLARCIEEALSNTKESARQAAAGRELVCAVYERRAVFARLREAVGARLRDESGGESKDRFAASIGRAASSE